MKRYVFTALTVAIAIPTAWVMAQQSRPAPQVQPARPASGTQPVAPAPARADQAAPVPGLTTPKQKVSYGIGRSIGRSMHSTQLTPDDLDLQALVRGLTDSLTEAKSPLSDEELKKVMTDFQTSMVARQQERAKTVAEKNKKEGDAFLAANKTKDGVKTLPSGLQYKVLKSGTGATPGLTDTVVAHYKGTLLNGKVFDSSYDRGEPTSFPVNRVIPGWTEALQLMKVGDKWQLFIPAEKAYGEDGAGEDIGPNAVLVFEVELLDVKKGSAPAGFSQ